MLLNNRYLIEDPTGRDVMSTIGIDTHTNKRVAIKVLLDTYSSDPKFVTRFQREAKIMASLQHPNIVMVYDYGEYDSKYFIVMELIEGTDLRRYVRARGKLDADNMVRIAYNVTLGLGAAHRRGVLHRNVKPTSILLGRDGSIKLTDFSIASVNDMSRYGATYYSPEQVQGEIVTPASDVYSLGIIMYEMATEQTPFDGATPEEIIMQHIHDTPTNPSQFNPNIPDVLEEIMMRCLEKSPDRRFRDVHNWHKH